MANMSKKTRDLLFPIIVKKQNGEFCAICKRDSFMMIYSGQDDVFMIDHIDNNNNNNSITNIQILCRSCNTKKNNPNTEPFERKPTIEYRVSKKNLFRARKYIAGRINDPVNNSALPIEELVNDLAEFLDCSQQAIKNYLAKFCSKQHGIYTVENRNGDDYLVYKNDEEMAIVMQEFQPEPDVN